MKVQGHSVIDPLWGAVYVIPEEFSVDSDDFKRCCGHIFSDIIHRKRLWRIPLTDCEIRFRRPCWDDLGTDVDDLLKDEEFLLYEQLLHQQEKLAPEPVHYPNNFVFLPSNL